MLVGNQIRQNNLDLRNHLEDIKSLPDIADLRRGEYVWKKLTAEGGDFVTFVPSNDPAAYPSGGVHKDGFWYELYGKPEIPLQIVTWADGTDEQIAAMVEAADEGRITLSDYWAVGQERKVTLSQMAATGVGETHAQQEATLVLMNTGGKELVNGNECSFIVGLKNCLKEQGYMNSTSTNSGGWASTKRRTWCNEVFKNAIPAALLPIFKQFKHGSTEDLFALPYEREVYGENPYAASEVGLLQFEWYMTALNRQKKLGDDGNGTSWFVASAYNSNTISFCLVATNGNANYSGAINSFGISPFGCI